MGETIGCSKEKGWNENKEKSKPVKESMENMNENQDIKANHQ